MVPRTEKKQELNQELGLQYIRDLRKKRNLSIENLQLIQYSFKNKKQVERRYNEILSLYKEANVLLPEDYFDCYREYYLKQTNQLRPGSKKIEPVLIYNSKNTNFNLLLFQSLFGILFAVVAVAAARVNGVMQYTPLNSFPGASTVCIDTRFFCSITNNSKNNSTKPLKNEGGASNVSSANNEGGASNVLSAKEAKAMDAFLDSRPWTKAQLRARFTVNERGETSTERCDRLSKEMKERHKKKLEEKPTKPAKIPLRTPYEQAEWEEARRKSLPTSKGTTPWK